MGSPGMGWSWLSRTPEPTRTATHRVTAASLEMSWQWFVLRQTFPLPPPPSASPVSCVVSPSCVQEMLPARPQLCASITGSEARAQGETGGFHQGPRWVSTWNSHMLLLSPETGEGGVPHTRPQKFTSTSRTPSGGLSFNKYLLSTALCGHRVRPVHRVVNKTVALAFLLSFSA